MGSRDRTPLTVKLGVCERWHRFHRIRLGTDGPAVARDHRCQIDWRVAICTRHQMEAIEQELSRRSQSADASDTLGRVLT